MPGSSLRQRGVDGRVKPGQDGRGSEASWKRQPTAIAIRANFFGRNPLKSPDSAK
jgi:hypothetical protein